MSNKQGLVRLLNDLLNEMGSPNAPGPLEKQFFKDPFCTMSGPMYQLEADDRNALLTLDRDTVVAHLHAQGCDECAKRMVDEYKSPTHGFDTTQGIRNYMDVDKYLECHGHQDFAGLVRMAASFGAGWPKPQQELREVWPLFAGDPKMLRLELIGEGLYPKGTVELRDSAGAAGHTLQITEVYVKSIFFTYLRTEETKYDSTWYGTWTVVFLPDSAPYGVTYGPQLVLNENSG
jgi:hypothetical protein